MKIIINIIKGILITLFAFIISIGSIGIGIYGEEGMRAVQSSDYAIGEFKILRQLTLFHGRVNLIRISEMILFFFYKNFKFFNKSHVFNF